MDKEIERDIVSTCIKGWAIHATLILIRQGQCKSTNQHSAHEQQTHHNLAQKTNVWMQIISKACRTRKEILFFDQKLGGGQNWCTLGGPIKNSPSCKQREIYEKKPHLQFLCDVFDKAQDEEPLKKRKRDHKPQQQFCMPQARHPRTCMLDRSPTSFFPWKSCFALFYSYANCIRHVC